jgi:hypothetical protein
MRKKANVRHRTLKAEMKKNHRKMTSLQVKASKMSEKILILKRDRDALVYEYRRLDKRNEEIENELG